jgi:hypothetical protein
MSSKILSVNRAKSGAGDSSVRLAKNATHRTRIIILQFLVAALLTGGGAAFAKFAVNELGTTLGLIHLAVGIVSLVAAFSTLSPRTWSRGFLLSINVLAITYSIFSEILVETGYFTVTMPLTH